MLKGKILQKGDTIGFIGPSGAVRVEGAIERARLETERMGYRVKMGKSCGAKYGYLSGRDELRAQDVNEMFADPGVDAIFCVRGGYGTTRMLDRLDYDVIRSNPKIFAGYSDITAMQIAMLQKSGLATFAAPMPVSDWSSSPLDEFSLTAMLRVLGEAKPAGLLSNSPDYYARKTINPGSCEGMLSGGNLMLMTSLLGTPYELDTKGKILFIEEIGEHTYCIDRMLTQLRLAGKLDDCEGIVFGDFKNCEIEYKEYGFTIEEIIKDVVAPCGKPVFTGFQAGHCTPKITLPYGVNCRMDADACTLEVLEAAVKE